MDTTTNKGQKGEASLNEDRSRKQNENEAAGTDNRATETPGKAGSGQGLESASGSYNPAGKRPADKSDDRFDSQHSADRSHEKDNFPGEDIGSDLDITV